MKKGIIAILALIVIVGIWFSNSYNKLVTVNEAVDGQWAQVEAQYQRRFDLIPNLVESVKGAMTQEQSVFTAIAEARTRYAGAATVDEKAQAAGQVESALGRLLVVMENYPQLKSIETVQTLMVQIEGTENRVSTERVRFNDQVRLFNVLVKRFPTNIISGMLGYSERAYFEAAAGTEVAPTVNLDLNK